MKYKITPINIFSGLLIVISIYGALFPGPMGFGLLLGIYLLPFGLLGFFLDYIGQKRIKKYWKLFTFEMLFLGMISFFYLSTKRTKTFIVQDNRQFEYVVLIYGVDGAKKLPIDFLTWSYKKVVPENGIVTTSTEMHKDLPQTEIYTESGISLQNTKDSIDLCFGRVSCSQIMIGTNKYDYQIWKIDSGGAVCSSSKDLKLMEQRLKEYLIQNIF